MINDVVHAFHELRDTIDYLLSLPAKLVNSFYDTIESLHTRRERIERLKVLVEYREIGKSLSNLYSAKGDITEMIKQAQLGNEALDPADVKFELGILCDCLDSLKKDIEGIVIQDNAVLLEVASRLGAASRLYRRLFETPDDLFYNFEFLSDSYAQIQEMHNAGIALVRAVDEERKMLDYHNG